MAEPVLKKGSNDPAVRDLQEALKALGSRSRSDRRRFRGQDGKRGQGVSSRRRESRPTAWSAG